MPYTEDERRKLADAVRRRRIAKNLDKEPAARAAKINSITWSRVEDAEGVRDSSLSKILESLGLPGVDDILRGPPPEVAANHSGHVPPGWVDAADRLWEHVVAVADVAVGAEVGIEIAANRAVVVAADVLSDMLIAVQPTHEALPLIRETSVRGVESMNRLAELQKGSDEESDELPLTVSSDDPKVMAPGHFRGSPYRTAQHPGVSGDEYGDKRHEL